MHFCKFIFWLCISHLSDVTQQKGNTHIHYLSVANCIPNIIPIHERQFHDIPCEKPILRKNRSGILTYFFAYCSLFLLLRGESIGTARATLALNPAARSLLLIIWLLTWMSMVCTFSLISRQDTLGLHVVWRTISLSVVSRVTLGLGDPFSLAIVPWVLTLLTSFMTVDLLQWTAFAIFLDDSPFAWHLMIVSFTFSVSFGVFFLLFLTAPFHLPSKTSSPVFKKLRVMTMMSLESGSRWHNAICPIIRNNWTRFNHWYCHCDARGKLALHSFLIWQLWCASGCTSNQERTGVDQSPTRSLKNPTRINLWLTTELVPTPRGRRFRATVETV